MADSTFRREMNRDLTRQTRRRWFAPPSRRLRRSAGECAHGARRRLERGDVPGWVMVTLMTAGLVIVIWGMAGGALSNVFQTAIDRVLAF